MKSHIFSSLVVALAITTSAPAAIVFDTLSVTPASTNFFKGPTGFLPYLELGYVFHVPSTADFQLDSLAFSFGANSSTAAPLELAAFSIGSGTPQGTLLTTFSGPLFPVSTIGTYTPDTAITLPAGTDVFFRFKVATAGGLYRVNNTNTALSPSDWSFVQTYYGDISGNWSTVTSAPIMQINATAVPEPGSIALLGASALFLIRRRRCA